MRREQLDKLDARMDRVTEKDILDADLDGIVDAPSDDEGDENADVDGYHADRIQEQDDEEVAAVVKNIQEGWASRRSGRNRRRGQLGPAAAIPRPGPAEWSGGLLSAMLLPPAAAGATAPAAAAAAAADFASNCSSSCSHRSAHSSLSSGSMPGLARHHSACTPKW